MRCIFNAAHVPRPQRLIVHGQLLAVLACEAEIWLQVRVGYAVAADVDLALLVIVVELGAWLHLAKCVFLFIYSTLSCRTLTLDGLMDTLQLGKLNGK